jgi:hypothetical protein
LSLKGWGERKTLESDGEMRVTEIKERERESKEREKSGCFKRLREMRVNEIFYGCRVKERKTLKLKNLKFFVSSVFWFSRKLVTPTAGIVQHIPFSNLYTMTFGYY